MAICLEYLEMVLFEEQEKEPASKYIVSIQKPQLHTLNRVIKLFRKLNIFLNCATKPLMALNHLFLQCFFSPKRTSTASFLCVKLKSMPSWQSACLAFLRPEG